MPARLKRVEYVRNSRPVRPGMDPGRPACGRGVLAGLRAVGVECLDRLIGMFALLIWREENQMCLTEEGAADFRESAR